MRAAGYLHNIGKVTVDKHLLSKPGALEPENSRRWPSIPCWDIALFPPCSFRGPIFLRSCALTMNGPMVQAIRTSLHNDEVSLPVKIVGVADTFDAMLSERPYRKKISLGEAAAQLSWLAPAKLDGEVVHALLVQLRRDAVASTSMPRPWASAAGNRDRKLFLDRNVAGRHCLSAGHRSIVSELNHRTIARPCERLRNLVLASQLLNLGRWG